MIELAAGGQHTCALRHDGHTLCWGDNSWGELGNGEFGRAADAATPTVVVE